MNTKTNQGLISPCESKVNTNDSIETPIDMAIQVEECGLVDNRVEIEKESASKASEVESTNMANRSVETPVETMMENTDMTNDAGQLVPKEE
jgi:hypothetical protein